MSMWRLNVEASGFAIAELSWLHLRKKSGSILVEFAVDDARYWMLFLRLLGMFR